jgi:hypothetical protein
VAFSLDELKRIQRIERMLSALLGVQISTFGTLVALFKTVPQDSSDFKKVSNRLDEVSDRIDEAMKILGELNE